MAKLTPAKQEAIERYHQRTYNRMTFTLRIEEDADIIASIEEAQKKGISYREWLRELFENQKGE